jgi:hypothetical protein
MKIGKLKPLGKLNFPGFQRILDFTATGSESSVSVAVDGDTDKEYTVIGRNLNSSNAFRLYLNNDTGANYGFQYLDNNSGTLTAAQGTTAFSGFFHPLGISNFTLLTPSGLIKSLYSHRCQYGSGTTVTTLNLQGNIYNSTSNIISLNFITDSGNFTAGTRIIAFARRSNV